MSTLRAYCFIVILLLIVCSSTFGRDDQHQHIGGPISKIEQAYSAGQVSLDEKALLQIAAIKNPESLPAAYALDGTSGISEDPHAATLAIVDIKKHWDVYSAETKRALTAALARPSGTYTYVAPSGFFLLHYDISGTNAVPTADNDASGVPDYVEKCASYMDTSLTKHRELGYLDPPSDNGIGGDELYDVYFESMGYYGYAVPEGPGDQPWNDSYSYLVLHNNYYGFPPNDDPEGDQLGAAKATAAHEFHHSIQFAYDPNDYGWFMEADATYFEDIAFEHVNDNYNYLGSYMGSPETSLMEFSLHSYASFIWPMFLAEHIDTSLMVSVWEGGRYDNVFDAMSDTLEVMFGWTQDSAFVQFTYWNYITGSRDDGMHYGEGDNYPLLTTAATHSSFPLATVTGPEQVEGYAASYIEFLPGADEGMLRIEFDGSNVRQWGAFAIVSSAINSHQIQLIDLDPSSYEGYVDIPDFDQQYRVTLVAVNLSEFSTGSSFDYSAYIVRPDKVRSEILTDTAAYAGETRNWEVKVYNLYTEGEVLEVQVTEEKGWVLDTTEDIYLAAGDSGIVEIAVTPPDTASIDSRSNMEFRAQVKTDPYAFDTHSTTAVIVPKRGDVNRSGKITLSDITFLISYVYLHTGPPEPPELGDFDCSGKITLSDITKVISRVYLHGPDSECDPYEH